MMEVSMATKEQMIKAIEEYCKFETEKNRSGWLALFADDAVHEDPVGLRINAGIDKIAAFWDSFQPANVELWLTEPPIICGNEVIALMKCTSGPANARLESGRTVDNFVFNDAGKITRVRSFYTYDV
jgi:steroid Delta-isomerase